MSIASSNDGTNIAYDKTGSGPALVVVDGALTTRLSGSKPELIDLLAPHFTVYSYDRRGRGESGDTLPHTVQREIEDLEALIDEAGGTACLYGHSSGGALVLETARDLGAKVTKLAMYEVPYDNDPNAQQAWGEYIEQLTESLATDRRGDAVALFMRYVGMPAEPVNRMRQTPLWPNLEAIAPTLAYDHTALLGPTASVPAERASGIVAPTLVLFGESSYPFMRDTARILSEAIPDAELRGLDGQSHDVSPAALAPVLTEFFAS